MITKKRGGSVLDAIIDGNTIQIGDIRAIKKGVGYGTIMMETLLRFARENSISSISGILVDSQNFDKLEYFYKKFGFKVTFNKDRIEGKIFLDLQ